jgi:hypothetical protein
MTASSAIPQGSGLTFANDPLIAPQPPGTRGQRGIYLHSRGAEEYFFDGICWQSANRSTFLEFPTNTNIQYDFWSDDVDADYTFNSAYNNLSLISTWKNRGGSVTVNAIQTTDYAVPTLVKPSIHGRDALYFNGNFNHYGRLRQSKQAIDRCLVRRNRNRDQFH